MNEQHEIHQRMNWGRWGVLVSTLALFIFICVFAYGYFQLSKVNMALATALDDQQKQATTDRNETATLQKSVEDLQQAFQKVQALSAQQQQLINDWQSAQKGDMNKWYVAEAQYLVKLANDHLVYAHNVPMAVALVQRADQVLQNLQDDAFLEIRKALTTDLANLQTLPRTDITELYLQLSTLNNQIDQLPLPARPFKDNENQHQYLYVENQATPWWQVGLNHTWDALRKIVIVRYNTSNTLPLVMPEEKVYLYQNLHAQLEGASWALLHHNNTVFQDNLKRMQTWIPQYFEKDSLVTKSVLNTLQDLQKVNLQRPEMNLSATLQLFDAYFAKK